MAKIIITTEGDMADEIAWKVYGDRPEGLVAILEANPGLCRYPPMLPAGLRIVCPDLPERPIAPAASVRIFT
ncbi:tail protein X [Shinella sp. CPCC 100929]|uniref:Tail protein X n=1 Tax=Shinella lacus TaxID=2654216 RepID=A0ABT1R6Z9_9HYPH|nr:tail protein X [Shinella lacus]MCQ4630952.1 tail protein X [Shinella lacus]